MALMRPSSIDSSILLVYLKRAFLCPVGVVGIAGVAVTLLRLVWEVAAGVEKVDRREGVGRRGGSITILKQGVAIGAWWQRGSLKSPTKIKDPLCEVKYGASSGGLPIDRLNYRFYRSSRH